MNDRMTQPRGASAAARASRARSLAAIHGAGSAHQEGKYGSHAFMFAAMAMPHQLAVHEHLEGRGVRAPRGGSGWLGMARGRWDDINLISSHTLFHMYSMSS